MKQIINLVLILPLTVNATCYTVVDNKGTVLYQATKAPFDLSGPPDSAEYVAAKKKGLRIQISPDCPVKQHQTNIEIANDLAQRHNTAIAAELRRQAHEEYEINRREVFIKEADEELLRRGEIAVKQLRQLNDLDNQ